MGTPRNGERSSPLDPPDDCDQIRRSDLGDRASTDQRGHVAIENRNPLGVRSQVKRRSHAFEPLPRHRLEVAVLRNAPTRLCSEGLKDFRGPA